MQRLILIVFCCVSISVFGQRNSTRINKDSDKTEAVRFKDNLTQLNEIEVELHQLLQSLRKHKQRYAIDSINTLFKATFKEALTISGAFSYPFDSFTTIGDIRSNDGLVRVFTWNVQYLDLSASYNSFILKKEEHTNDVSLIELIPQKATIEDMKYETVSPENWYGALYYDIIDVKRRNRTYYTLFGYDINNKKSQIKMIDVLYFTGNSAHFGFPLFQIGRERKKRMIFEYSKKAVMSLRYDSIRQLVIFDHLSPKTPSLEGFREFYVPDMSYDAFSWDGRYWVYKEDIIAINSKESNREKVNLKAYDEDLDSVVTVTVKSKWISPNDNNAPIDGGTHKALTPEDLKKMQQSEDKEREKRRKRRRNRDRSYPNDSKIKSVQYSHLKERLEGK